MLGKQVIHPFHPNFHGQIPILYIFHGLQSLQLFLSPIFVGLNSIKYHHGFTLKSQQNLSFFGQMPLNSHGSYLNPRKIHHFPWFKTTILNFCW